MSTQPSIKIKYPKEQALKNMRSYNQPIDSLFFYEFSRGDTKYPNSAISSLECILTINHSGKTYCDNSQFTHRAWLEGREQTTELMNEFNKYLWSSK